MGNACVAPNGFRRTSRKDKNPRENEEKRPNRFEKLCKKAFNGGPQNTIIKDVNGNNILDRFELGRELGRGAYGVTYLCIDRETEEQFACKSIKKKRLYNQSLKDCMMKEVEVMRLLPAHPNIITLEAIYEDNRAIHLVMELCTGGELYDRIVAKGRYSEREARPIAKSILKAVEVFHKHGIIHRDLKPENFLFAHNSHRAPLKAIDFGISQTCTSGQVFDEIIGTKCYMAPEMHMGEYGQKIDIWSCGVIIYVLLCGENPFDSEEEEVHEILPAVLRFEADHWEMVSKDAKDLIKGMLNPNPVNRFSAKQALAHPWFKAKVQSATLGEESRIRYNGASAHATIMGR